ncbi:hypothetical protein GOBAR_AA10046 [Gossypium barbadense]|uniref:Fe2OG dioxygenase domain-containing protein n=1 Tax=Gossypium barbadense TaxID=3634 RepID=A0A2P5Y4U2_GOSBA|nr:hypothetical protein GOBAR_AA10046 [Gossypium barbadense]
MPEPKACIELPVFDVSQPLCSSSLSSLYLACTQWGFFRITNHGVPKHLFTNLYSLSNHIFSLSIGSKLKAGPASSLKTYTPPFIASPFYESLLVSGPDFFSSAQSSVDVLFDHPKSDFSEVLDEYGNMMTKLSKEIVKAVLKSLVEEDLGNRFVESEFRNCHRSNEGKWMDISPCEDTLVVNVGDLMQAWSNGKLRSSEHRVVLKRNVNRFSLAFFWCFEDEKVIFAPNEVVGDHSRIYKPFVCADYLKFRLISEKGKFERVGFTVKDFAGNCDTL